MGMCYWNGFPLKDQFLHRLKLTEDDSREQFPFNAVFSLIKSTCLEKHPTSHFYLECKRAKSEPGRPVPADRFDIHPLVQRQKRSWIAGSEQWKPLMTRSERIGALIAVGNWIWLLG